MAPGTSLYGESLNSQVSFIATYHNLYAIIIVVTAFVNMESAVFDQLMTSHVYDAK